MLSGVAAAAETPAAALEAKLAAAVQSDQITVVHFWAPWCPNCKHELAHHGWSDFLAAKCLREVHCRNHLERSKEGLQP